MTHSRVRQASNARLSTRFRSMARHRNPGALPVGERKLPFTQELMMIFSSLSASPDFRQCFEPDLDRRVRNAWTRVGNAMRLALGERVEIASTLPDGRRATRHIRPLPRREEYRDALDRARRSVRGTGSEEAKFRMNFHITGDSVRVIKALIEDSARNGREAQGERNPS